MDIAFYMTHGTIEFLPHVTLSKASINGKCAYILMVGWLQWVLDLQWQ